MGGLQALASPLAVVALALLLLPASAAAQAPGALKGNPRLASLAIEIWPEYDRPAALVILRAAVAEGVKLPAAVAMRLPLASGGPSAVAYSATADGNLLNLNYERATQANLSPSRSSFPSAFSRLSSTSRLRPPSPRAAIATPGRAIWRPIASLWWFRSPPRPAPYRWSRISRSSPPAGRGCATAPTELGAIEAGKPLPIVVRYTKLDGRPSAELMKPKAGEAPVAAAAPAVSDTWFPGGVRALRAGAWLALAAAPLFFWWVWRRQSPARARPATLPHGACTQCGKPQARGNRFCGSCGTKLG